MVDSEARIRELEAHIKQETVPKSNFVAVVNANDEKGKRIAKAREILEQAQAFKAQGGFYVSVVAALGALEGK